MQLDKNKPTELLLGGFVIIATIALFVNFTEFALSIALLGDAIALI